MNTLITERKPELVAGAGTEPAKTRFRMSERSAMITAFGAFAVLLGLSVLGSMAISSANEQQATASFESRKLEVTKSLNERLATYTQVLRGGLGLFAASTAVDRGEWKAYVESLEIDKRYPGIQGVGYAELIQPADMPAYLESVRADGFPDFTVRPDGARELILPLLSWSHSTPGTGRLLATICIPRSPGAQQWTALVTRMTLRFPAK